MRACQTPPKPRHGDRFIPTRAGNTWDTCFPVSPASSTSSSAKDLATRPLGSWNKQPTANDTNCNNGQGVYSNLLKNEVLRDQIENVPVLSPSPTSRKLFKFDSSERSNFLNSAWSPYSLSPINANSAQLLNHSYSKGVSKISKVPLKALDAPQLREDFCLNLVDWSSKNSVAVGLGESVWLWSTNQNLTTDHRQWTGVTGEVTQLCDTGSWRNPVSSIAWNEKGTHLAVGTETGLVQVWDAARETLVNTIWGHTARVGTMAWSQGDTMLSTGSRDCCINQSDLRTNPVIIENQLAAHTGEICGLAWSPDKELLASGGNDNVLNVWSVRHSERTILTYREHTAAVRAIAWSPHQYGLLASGGGFADETIRFWNTITGQAKSIRSITTDSQVCNLAWSPHSAEFVSTHGYSTHLIKVWKYPSLEKIGELDNGRYDRAMYLSMSPRGENIVTGGYETLRFWNVFKKRKDKRRSELDLYKIR
ncbi:Fizzy-related protein [Folsomia candida]|uniref:Fizzy-related protein n=1 Tax=Folsomia candida TaxID=158441 RepID=A0A226DT76_FOLCA|nr:Fizzy-related protein [Folsomia candida]